ncbi:MAG TPA: LysM peptidoglycan-binding domain-containing protein [Hanamia sp.]|jgi:LysM repeat protein|nr:LysM peptidoglycan-binding domain-containing protein [Hanamia sp.]
MFKSSLVVLFTLLTGFLFAQNNLQIKGTGSNVYLEHVVSAKESFYSIGRMYNVSPKDLATFNHLKAGSGLEIGQDLKIPLSKNNFLQEGRATNNEALIPVYHTISSGETLYRLGVNYNKVPLPLLKKWNHLSSDAVNVGTPMIVGYLKVDKSLSPLAKSKATAPAEVAVESQKEVNPVSQTNEPVAQKPEPVKEVAATNTEKKESSTPATATAQPATNDVRLNNGSDFSGGYFKNLYNQQNQQNSLVDKSGSAGVFKSTSGWQDGKYYCFNNDAAPGTILKVTNNATGKTVYAKVLDAIPDIKQNSGLLVIISNAAAQELGAGENKFDCIVSYSK